MALPLSEQLRAVRVAAGLTQADLADRIGVARPTVTQIEAGKPTTTTTLEAWAAACGVEVLTGPRQSELIEVTEALPSSDRRLLIGLARLLPRLGDADRRTLALLVDGWNAAYPSVTAEPGDCQQIVKTG